MVARQQGTVSLTLLCPCHLCPDDLALPCVCSQGYQLMTRVCVISTAAAVLAGTFAVALSIIAWRSPLGLVAGGGWPLVLALVLAGALSWVAAQLWEDRRELFENTSLQSQAAGGRQQGGLIQVPDRNSNLRSTDFPKPTAGRTKPGAPLTEDGREPQ